MITEYDSYPYYSWCAETLAKKEMQLTKEQGISVNEYLEQVADYMQWALHAWIKEKKFLSLGEKKTYNVKITMIDLCEK